MDVLVNNAGIGAVTSLDDPNMLTEFDKLMEINVRSVVVMTQLALPHLEKTKGSIVNVSSVASIKAVSYSKIFSINFKCFCYVML